MKTEAQKALDNIKNNVLKDMNYAEYLAEVAKEVDQDWENETTIYTFEDESLIKDTNGELNVEVNTND